MAATYPSGDPDRDHAERRPALASAPARTHRPRWIGVAIAIVVVAAVAVVAYLLLYNGNGSGGNGGGGLGYLTLAFTGDRTRRALRRFRR
jgi:hypothetical protein